MPQHRAAVSVAGLHSRHLKRLAAPAMARRSASPLLATFLVAALVLSCVALRAEGRVLQQSALDWASWVGGGILDGVELIMDYIKQVDVLSQDVDLKTSLSSYPKSALEAVGDVTKFIVNTVSLAGLHYFLTDILKGPVGTNKDMLSDMYRTGFYAGAMYENEFIVFDDPSDWLAGYINVDRADLIKVSNKNYLSVQPYYVFFDRPLKRVLVVVRGTVSPSKNDCVGTQCSNRRIEWDWLTNLHGVAQVTRPGEAAHYGMLSSARNMLTEAGPAILAALQQEPGFTLHFTGHSLGAGVASLACYLVKKGLGPGAQFASAQATVRATLFATPAVLSMDAAADSNAYMDTIFVQDDCVVRLGPASLDTLLVAVKFQGGSISGVLYDSLASLITSAGYGLNSIGIGRRARARVALAQHRLLQEQGDNSTNSSSANATDPAQGIYNEPLSGFNMTSGKYVRQTKYTPDAVLALAEVFGQAATSYKKDLRDTKTIAHTLEDEGSRKRRMAQEQADAAAGLEGFSEEEMEQLTGAAGGPGALRQLLTTVDGIDISSPSTVTVPPQFGVNQKLIFPLYATGNLYQIILAKNGGGKIISQASPQDRVHTLYIKTDMIDQHFLPFIRKTIKAIIDA